jgi:molybdopterin molybdotransferase
MDRNSAKKLINSLTQTKSFEVVTLENAYNKILYEDIFSPIDIPDNDKSAVDGFAININTNSKKFKITDEIRAGQKEKELIEGAIAIMTGANIPKGANAVVRIEDVKIENGYIYLEKLPKKGELINYKASEIQKNQKVLEKNSLLDYKKIALLAQLGIYSIKVYSKVDVAIVVSGDEIKEVYENGGVKNSNLYILKGLLKNCNIKYYGRIEDDLEKLKEIFKLAKKENDVVISSGGASKGKYDFTLKAAKDAGFKIHFTKTNIRPGRPLIFGSDNEKLFFGLPGYPSALLVNSIEFLLPAIRKMSGGEFENRYFKAILTQDIKAKKGRVDFIRGVVNFDKEVTFTPSFSQQTSNFISTAFSNALAIIDENSGDKKSGEIVECIKI